jgi:hypothetical protein
MTAGDDNPMRKHARAYDEVVRQASRLVENVRCICHECWTSRGQHDPKGCVWEATSDLRSAVESERKAFSEWRQANKKRLAAERIG